MNKFLVLLVLGLLGNAQSIFAAGEDVIEEENVDEVKIYQVGERLPTGERVVDLGLRMGTMQIYVVLDTNGFIQQRCLETCARDIRVQEQRQARLVGIQFRDLNPVEITPQNNRRARIVKGQLTHVDPRLRTARQ